MIVTSAINLALAILCALVMIQALRMDRRIRALRDGQLEKAVDSLDNATQQARLVLAELKRVLSTEAAAHGEIIQIAHELRDELSVMVGIGNSVAERIIEASEQANAAQAGIDLGVTRSAPARRDPLFDMEPGDELPLSTEDPAASSPNLRSIVHALHAKRGNREA